MSSLCFHMYRGVFKGRVHLVKTRYRVNDLESLPAPSVTSIMVGDMRTDFHLMIASTNALFSPWKPSNISLKTDLISEDTG